MQLPDINILVYAHREDTEQHQQSLSWLEGRINSGDAFAMYELVFAFLRTVTTQQSLPPASWSVS